MSNELALSGKKPPRKKPHIWLYKGFWRVTRTHHTMPKPPLNFTAYGRAHDFARYLNLGIMAKANGGRNFTTEPTT